MLLHHTHAHTLGVESPLHLIIRLEYRNFRHQTFGRQHETGHASRVNDGVDCNLSGVNNPGRHQVAVFIVGGVPSVSKLMRGRLEVRRLRVRVSHHMIHTPGTYGYGKQKPILLTPFFLVNSTILLKTTAPSTPAFSATCMQGSLRLLISIDAPAL